MLCVSVTSSCGFADNLPIHLTFYIPKIQVSARLYKCKFAELTSSASQIFRGAGTLSVGRLLLMMFKAEPKGCSHSRITDVLSLLQVLVSGPTCLDALCNLFLYLF